MTFDRTSWVRSVSGGATTDKNGACQTPVPALQVMLSTYQEAEAFRGLGVNQLAGSPVLEVLHKDPSTTGWCRERWLFQ
jgi:hypothetical protein